MARILATVAAVIACMAPTHLWAQNFVRLQSNTITFDTAPPLEEWSALSVGFDNGSGVVTTTAEMDALVQQQSIANISNSLPSRLSTGQYNYATWNATDRRIQSRPGNNWFALLAGKFSNATSETVQVFSLTYQVTSGLLFTETIPGFRVYCSLTGEVNSWRVVEGLSTGETGMVSSIINLFPNVWFPSAPLYILWADDNGPGTDGYYTIDDLQMEVRSRLTVRRLNETEIEISWPQEWRNCWPEATTNLGSPFTHTQVGTYTCDDGICTLRVSANTQQFYRMRCSVVIPQSNE